MSDKDLQICLCQLNFPVDLVLTKRQTTTQHISTYSLPVDCGLFICSTSDYTRDSTTTVHFTTVICSRVINWRMSTHRRFNKDDFTDYTPWCHLACLRPYQNINNNNNYQLQVGVISVVQELGYILTLLHWVQQEEINLNCRNLHIITVHESILFVLE